MEPEWTQQEAIDYECAVECISDMVSIRTAKIAREERAPHPDRAQLDRWEAEVQQLCQEQSAPTVHSHEHIARILRDYGEQIRAHRAADAAAWH